MPQRLGKPHVPDPRDDPLIDERIADHARLIHRPQARHDLAGVRARREQIRPERSYGPAPEREDGPVPLRGLPLGAAKNQPRRALPGTVANAPYAPTPTHAEVAADDDAAVEVQEQVLANGLDALEHPPVDGSGDSGHTAARIRALGTQALACKNLQAFGDAVERVTLGHARSVPATSQSSRSSSSSSALKIASENVG
jgi:hypothetical protein